MNDVPDVRAGWRQNLLNVHRQMTWQTKNKKGQILFGLCYSHGNTQVTQFLMSGHRRLKEKEPNDCHYIQFVHSSTGGI